MDREPQRHALGRSQNQAAVDGRGRLIGMALHVGRHPEHTVGGSVLAGRPESSGSAGNERSRRRANASSQRHLVVDLESEWPIPNGLTGGGNDTVVLGVGGTMLADMAHGPLVGESGAHDTTSAEGQSDGVESRAEIGRGGRGRGGGPVVHSSRISGVTVTKVSDIFDLENLFPQLILALGLALVVGNGLAWWKNRRGESPEGVEDAQFRPGRVVFLSVVGVLLTIWGAVTLFT